MSTFKRIEYETPDPSVARIWLNRPEARNAQDVEMLYELNAAFDQAIRDDAVKVIILAARGPHFSAGHDVQESTSANTMGQRKPVGTWASDNWFDPEGYYAREKEIYEGFCRRWRDLSKPTIAQVQGKVIAGGLLLVWPMDFIIAADNASFQDNTMAMGIPGVEYFAHAWELGIRKAKAFLLAGEPITAPEAQQIGMVNKVVTEDELEAETLKFAKVIASKPAFALKLGKDLINATYSAQGFDNVQKAAFNAHHLAHTHYRLSQDGAFCDKEFLDSFNRKKSK